jgi:hypothetical protein
MEVGDKVYLYSGEGREIKELKFEYLDSPIKVYNFEVEDWHTYFVSEQDVFVHNSCGGDKPQSGDRTFEGFVKNNVSQDAEVGLYTKSGGFNNNNGNVGGQFKRFGTSEHAGLSPHVHQPIRNVAQNGNVYGSTGSKTSN